jgi:hypothetical protein
LVRTAAIRIPASTASPAMKMAPYTAPSHFVQPPKKNSPYTVLGLWAIALGLLGLTAKRVRDNRELTARSLEDSQLLQKIDNEHDRSENINFWWRTGNSAASAIALLWLIIHSSLTKTSNEGLKDSAEGLESRLTRLEQQREPKTPKAKPVSCDAVQPRKDEDKNTSPLPESASDDDNQVSPYRSSSSVQINLGQKRKYPWNYLGIG